ncbi:hypothetical protein M408DRAFT_26268 [Serendipita vermifera MAFF 305830]|uniref:DUF6533 domain-containing protein n=1 Tax=Serendipita vermifera MAFF 305830 TaxID=933852 RepID=A0A0C3AL08_SERVB|nr:hypothetical protein M408DRAFT_26268 [Serendipita vermifera MAFF 305830]
MSSPSTSIRELTLAIDNIHVSRFTSGAAATLVFYDFLLVFGQEFNTIYRSRGSLAKCLFCFVRFITPLGMVLGTIRELTWFECRGTLNDVRILLVDTDIPYRVTPIFLTYAMITSLMAADGLFTLQLVALYKSKQYMVWFISTFYLASYAVTYGLAIEGTIELTKYPAFYTDLLHACVSFGRTALLAPVWYAPVAFETFLFSLTVYKAWYDAKVISTTSAPLLVLFYRDGTIAFIVMTGVRVWNIWVYTTQPISSIYVGTMLMWALNTVLATRVYMNLVWFVRRPVQSTGMVTTAAVAFAGKRERTTDATDDSTNLEMQASSLAQRHYPRQ